MADGEKPYRVYRGGRTRGRVPLTPRPEKEQAKRPAGVPTEGGPRWGLRIGITLGLLFLLLVVWTALSYVSFRDGVEAANARLPRAVRANLAEQEGAVISKPSLILLLGTDGDRTAAREDARRSDSILIVRTDPKRHRLAYLSIPRDLRVDIPGHGPNKINAAFQLGGPVLTMKTVKALTGLQVNHIVLVDFENFREVIDALGGIEIDVPKPILSNRFDCPYSTDARCREWQGWRFEKGKQKMDGRRALIYSRIRENKLDLAENDLTRGGRQQEVVEAMTDKIVSPSTFVRLPFIGDDLMTPLTTDMSSGQLLQLGWVKFRANSSRALHCRLGGEPQSIGGESVLIATEENTAAIAMFIGRSAAQPPPPGAIYAAGCVIGTGRSG